MNYITSQEAATKWGLTRRTVQMYCQSGKIPGAVNPGKQWLLPEDAEKPRDGRFVENTHTSEAGTYHYPLLIFSKYYISRFELSGEEAELLDAQLLNLRCEYTASVSICRKLIDKSSSPSVRFGALLTNVSNFMLTGLISEITACVKGMEAICAEETAHQEDYRLIISYVEYTYRLNAEPFMKIDVSKISADAMTTFNLLAIGSSVFNDRGIPGSSLKLFESVCRNTDLLGITPAAVTIHGYLALICLRKGDKAQELRHIEEVCRLCCAEGFERLLAKCCSLDISSYEECLRKYGKGFAAGIVNKTHLYTQKWKISFSIASADRPAIDASVSENEIMLLLAYKMSIHDISILKNIPEKKVQEIIKALCARLSLGSRKELAELFRSTYKFILKD